ncbi:hypothetical protein DOE78_20835 [Bacillus sp. Y1]|nr:hypothetical protein DOE78_20835 [Bacillus sp. Y1]
MFSPDKQKTNLAGRPAFWRDLAYDLGIMALYYSIEGLGAGAGQLTKPQMSSSNGFTIRGASIIKQL